MPKNLLYYRPLVYGIKSFTDKKKSRSNNRLVLRIKFFPSKSNRPIFKIFRFRQIILFIVRATAMTTVRTERIYIYILSINRVQ